MIDLTKSHGRTDGQSDRRKDRLTTRDAVASKNIKYYFYLPLPSREPVKAQCKFKINDSNFQLTTEPLRNNEENK